SPAQASSVARSSDLSRVVSLTCDETGVIVAMAAKPFGEGASLDKPFGSERVGHLPGGGEHRVQRSATVREAKIEERALPAWCKFRPVIVGTRGQDEDMRAARLHRVANRERIAEPGVERDQVAESNRLVVIHGERDRRVQDAKEGVRSGFG